MVENILKRDGTHKEFLSFKIEDAIKKAFKSEHITYDSSIFFNVLDRLKSKRVVAVEDIQDAIEKDEALGKLRPVFKKDGLVTGGNASGIGDGAGALIVADAKWAEQKGLTPIARLVSWGISGVDPNLMGIGPVPSSQKALAAAGKSVADMALVEINEAFSAQYIAVEKVLGLDRSITNVNGGAISLAHPLAASGARITATLIHALRRRGEQFGLAGACIGGGQGISVVVEAL